MAEGNSTFLGGAVPLEGESEIFQKNLENDILTITGKAGQTGDFLVLQNSSGTERFVVDKDGNITLGGDLSITGSFGVTGSSVFTGAITQSTGAVTIKGATLVTGAVQLNAGLTMSTGAGDIVLKKGSVGQTTFSKLQLALLNTTPTTTSILSRGDTWYQKNSEGVILLTSYLGSTTTPLLVRVRKDTFVTIGSNS